MISLRQIEDGDRSLIFYWRNMPAIRGVSINQDVISWKEHCEWFHEVVTGTSTHLYLGYVILKEEVFPIGHLRFDLEECPPMRSCEVSIYLLEGYKGRGFGTEALKEGLKEVKEIWPFVRSIYASILPGNEKAFKFFSKCDFRAIPNNEIRDTMLLVKKVEEECPCGGTGSIPAPDGWAICRKHWKPNG